MMILKLHKLLVSLTFVCVMSVYTATLQAQQIDLNKKNITTKKLLEQIQKQSGYYLWYPSAVLESHDKRAITLENVSLDDALQEACSNQGLSYQVIGKTIVLTEVEPLESTPKSSNTADSETLNTGYGYVDKKTSTASISKVDRADLSQTNSIDIASRLSGRVPGLEVTQNGSFRIRGQNSLNSGNDPLVLVDGVPFAGNLNLLDPNSVQDVSVLKDAGAAAMYGSRGANGVVLITTLSGDKSKASASGLSVRKKNNGTVVFNRTPAEAVIEEVAKWHHLEITYTEPMEVIYYSGELHANIPKNDLLKILKASGFHLKIAGSTLVVLPQS